MGGMGGNGGGGWIGWVGAMGLWVCGLRMGEEGREKRGGRWVGGDGRDFVRIVGYVCKGYVCTSHHASDN